MKKFAVLQDRFSRGAECVRGCVRMALETGKPVWELCQ